MSITRMKTKAYTVTVTLPVTVRDCRDRHQTFWAFCPALREGMYGYGSAEDAVKQLKRHLKASKR